MVTNLALNQVRATAHYYPKLHIWPNWAYNVNMAISDHIRQCRYLNVVPTIFPFDINALGFLRAFVIRNTLVKDNVNDPSFDNVDDIFINLLKTILSLMYHMLSFMTMTLLLMFLMCVLIIYLSILLMKILLSIYSMLTPLSWF